MGIRHRVREALAGIEESRRRTAAVADAIGRMEAQLRDADARIGGLTERVDVLQRKQEGMAVDLRERLPERPRPDELPEPRFPDEAAYRARVAALGEPLRVNLGCGEKPLPGYVNTDRRPLPGVDVVADVRRLPFAEGSLGEIASFHLVEHFRQHQLEVGVLPYWRSLLRPDGVLRIVTPDWQAMTARLREGQMTWDAYKVVTFGLQDYDGDDHFALYTPASLTAALERAGFTGVAVAAADRMNGLSPEMELTARPAA
jgi:predicted SAM-dependent methyltransferase